MRWKNMSDKWQVLKWQRVTGYGVNSMAAHCGN